MANKISIFSFFAGIGFLDLGFEKSGYPVKFVNEYDREFLSAYEYARKKMKIPRSEYGYHCGSAEDLLKGKIGNKIGLDMTKERKAGNIVGFIAGPPCPDFSVAGKNRGGSGENGRLSAIFINLVCKYKPDFFLFENVRGLWRTKIHREFYEKIKRQTHNADYITTEKLINALDFGAPQDRQRIILLGFKKELLKKLNVKFSDGVVAAGIFPWKKYAKYNSGDILKMPWRETDKYKTLPDNLTHNGIVKELTVEYWFQKNDVKNHPNAKHHFKPKAALRRFLSIDEGDVTKKSFKRLHRWRYSPTAAYGNNEVHIHPYEPRRISAAEAMAIQSLPKEFELPPDMTLTDMFKTIGNGVPFMASFAIAKTIKSFLQLDS